jgi:L-lactate dehydrogenase complex protein LldE
VDRFRPAAAIAMVELFERLGHRVRYPEDQTCCGQPPFNSGYQDEARAVARHQMRCFEGSEAVVVPSGSCAAMVKVFYPQLFDGHPEASAARQLAERTWEFSAFLDRRLGVTDVGASFAGKVTFHDGCHGLRELHLHESPRRLLRAVRGLELVEMREARSCCGFGGAFAVKMPEISTAMAEVKARSIVDTAADAVVSNDPSCLMQIEGYLRRQGNPIPCYHLAEVLVRQ